MTICPYCEQDYILEAKIKKTGQIIKICPECDTVWEGDVSAQGGCGYTIFMANLGLKDRWDKLEIIKEY